MLDSHEAHDFASDELDQREREMVTAMAPPVSPYMQNLDQAIEHAQKTHEYAQNLVQQFYASPLDANDDDEHMTSHGYVVRTSTERINDHETRIGRIEEMLRSWTGGR